MYRELVVGPIAGAILLGVVLTIAMGARARSVRGPVSRFPFFERIVSLGVMVLFLVLAISGFSDLVRHSEHMTGQALMAHMTAGGLFAGFLVVFAILKSHACRFGVGVTPYSLPYKLCFWLFILSSLVLIVTAVMPMLTWLGTNGQTRAITVHRYIAGGTIFFGVLMAFLGLLRKRA